MSLAKHAIALALSASLPIAAHATTPVNNFNFYVAGGSLIDTVSNAPSYISGNLQLIVRAFDAAGKQIQVTSNYTGLGATTGGLFASGDINGSNSSSGEYLTLTFNQAVNISSVSLSGWSNGLFGIGTESATFSSPTKSFSFGTNNDSGLLLSAFGTTGATGTTFKLQALGSSDFRLGGLNATVAVPEPGSYALMALGLAGIGLVARRRAA